MNKTNEAVVSNETIELIDDVIVNIMDDEEEIVISENVEEAAEEDDSVDDLAYKTKVFTYQSDPQIQGLYERWIRGKLILRPFFQRHFVWDEKRCSGLMESALLDIPLPQVYLSEEKNGINIIIDGQQRITAFFKFIKNEYSLKGLKDSAYLQYNGKFFKDLPPVLQDKIQYFSIRTILFKKECDDNLKFSIFEKLNMGGMSLNAQELRNCIYYGKYNNLLIEMAENPEFINLIQVNENGLKRMLHIQLVLRFATYFHSHHITSSLKQFMNKDMEKYQNSITDEEMKSLKTAFKNALSINRSLFGEHIFNRFVKSENSQNGEWVNEFNVILYELSMVSFAHRDKNLIYQHLDEIREAWINLLMDPEFLTVSNEHTSDKKNVAARFRMWDEKLNTILGNSTKEPRCFSRKLKDELFSTDPTCAICGNRIVNIDDAAVDHIDQYWLGGKTIPENARLAHMFCNNSRPRIEF